MKRAQFIIGLVVVLAVLVGGGWLVLRQQSKPEPITLTCLGGSEKTDFMRDEDVVRILNEKYNITVNWTSKGSYDQVQMSKDDLDAQGVNCLWPSSTSAQLVFEKLHSGEYSQYRSENIFQSPEVVYAGPQGTDALKQAGLVTEADKHLELDLKKLLDEQVLPKKQWQDLGAGKLRGPINVSSTDPARSNSGFTMSQLQLTMIASADQYQSPTLAEAKAALPTMRSIYDSQGLQATSSDNGFRQWLTQGGEYSAALYAGYENQIIQHATVSGNQEALMNNVRMLYPTPTIYSDHPLLALDDNAHKLIEALRDEELQKIGWQKYGFRSAVNAAYNDLGAFDSLPLAPQVVTVPATNPDVTLALRDCLLDATKCN